MTRYIDEMTSSDGPSIGRRVAHYRKLNGWTMEDLAARTRGEIGKGVVANIETGRKSEITVTQLLRLAEALSISPMALLVDLDDLTASADVDLVTESGDLRPLTNGEFIEWFSGTTRVDDAGDLDELLPSQLGAGRVINAVHALIRANQNYSETLATWASRSAAAADALHAAMQTAEEARARGDERAQAIAEEMMAQARFEGDMARERLERADHERQTALHDIESLGVRIEGGRRGTPTDPAE